jgi:hypothetical protein
MHWTPLSSKQLVADTTQIHLFTCQNYMNTNINKIQMYIIIDKTIKRNIV